MHRPTAAIAALFLAACTTTGTGGGVAGDGIVGGSPPEIAGKCDASDAQVLIGERVSEEIGQRLLNITGAEMLRWGPPRTAMTMDFRADRLTVSYDDDMAITRISCG